MKRLERVLIVIAEAAALFPLFISDREVATAFCGGHAPETFSLVATLAIGVVVLLMERRNGGHQLPRDRVF